MNLIETMAVNPIVTARGRWLAMLLVEQEYIRQNFHWLTSTVKGTTLLASGSLMSHGNRFDIEIQYSPFFIYRFDRIKITNHKIKFHDEIHVYYDLTLCLYHPRYDLPVYGYMPLHKIIPWISEWCHFYCEWKKYKVWLGDEIKHTDLIGNV